jgi:hypothetical protein
MRGRTSRPVASAAINLLIAQSSISCCARKSGLLRARGLES